MPTTRAIRPGGRSLRGQHPVDTAAIAQVLPADLPNLVVDIVANWLPRRF